MISFGDNVASRSLCCTSSRFCQRLSERALFLSCSWTTGGDEMVDPAAWISVLDPGGRFSRCRLCSISCCLDVSRYSWYRNARGLKATFRMSFVCRPQNRPGRTGSSALCQDVRPETHRLCVGYRDNATVGPQDPAGPHGRSNTITICCPPPNMDQHFLPPTYHYCTLKSIYII